MARSTSITGVLSALIVACAPAYGADIIDIDLTALTQGAGLQSVVLTGDTRLGRRDIDAYVPSALLGNHAGPEVIYRLDVDRYVFLEATIAGDSTTVDNDLQLIAAVPVGSRTAQLYGGVSSSRADKSLFIPSALPPGTYYLTVDAYKPLYGVEKPGVYQLSLLVEAPDDWVGTREVPIEVSLDISPFMDRNDTRKRYSDVIDYYQGYPQNESGPEIWYRLSVLEPSRVRMTLSEMASGTDIDLHLMDATGSALIRRDNTQITVDLAPGSYLLSADTYVNAYGERAGEYTLTIEYEAIASDPPPSGSGTLPGGGELGGAWGAVPPAGDDTPEVQAGLGLRLHPTRQLMLDLARTYVGQIDDRGGIAPNKKGWELLKDIYDTAYHIDAFAAWGTWGQDKIKRSGEDPNSWCGVYATAMIRKAGVLGAKWATGSGPTGLASGPRTDRNFVPGDILVMNNGSVHHTIFVGHNADGTMRTIDGNLTYNTVASRSTQRVVDVAYYYRVIDGDYVPAQ